MNFQDWLDAHDDKNSVVGPSMSAEQALDFLKDYLLGSDWYTESPCSGDQMNTEIVYAILSKYSKRFRSEKKNN